MREFLRGSRLGGSQAQSKVILLSASSNFKLNVCRCNIRIKMW
jgi:hypothetical protein